MCFVARGSQKDIWHSDTTDCCKSCTYCKRAFTKKNVTPVVVNCCHQRERCERCFLSRSIVFCQTCNQCPSCRFKSSCRKKTSKLLGNLGSSGCLSESSKHSQTWLHPPFSYLAELDKVTDHHELPCQSSQKPLSVGGITSAYEQKCSRTGSKSNILRVFQPTFLSLKTQYFVTRASQKDIRHTDTTDSSCRLVNQTTSGEPYWT